MPFNQILILLWIQLLILLLPSIGLYKLFRKAGLAGWKAFIPFYNTWTMITISGGPRWPFFLQFVPIVGWFVSMSIFVDFSRLFVKFRFYQHALAALLPAFYFPWLGFRKAVTFIGPEKSRLHKKSAAREWADALVFAVIAATLMRIFVFEAYAIPTPSMEKTMLVNDYLFVSKISYGPRIPNTPLSLPFIHNTLPFTSAPSYLQWINIPYTRWFASPIKRNDIVVFNLPAGDSTINKEDNKTKII